MAALCVAAGLLAAPASSAIAGESATRLVFSTWAGGHLRTYTVEPNGDAFRKLPIGMNEPRFSYDGTRLATRMILDGTQRSEGVHIVTADGELNARLAPSRRTIHSPSWRADGSTLMYEDDRALWTTLADGTQRQRITPDGWYGESAALSPNGRWIVFSKFQMKPASTSLYLMRADGLDAATPRPLTFPTSGKYDRDARWSHDGRSIVFERAVRTADSEVFSIWAIDPDVGTERLVAENGEDPAWSPDGTRVAFIGGRSLFTVSSTGADVRQVGELDGAWTGLDWGVVPECDVQGDSGDNVLQGTAGDDVICGGPGADRIVATGGNDLVLGGLGIDKMDFRDAEQGVTADLREAWIRSGSRHEILGVEGILGSPFDDILFGHAGRNVIAGYAGDDALIGRDGDDTLSGGFGDDVLRPGGGGDDLDGGEGRNTASFIDAAERVRVNLADGFAFGQGQDLLIRMTKVVGSDYDDFIVGNDGANVMRGGDGEDVLNGLDGPDDIFGGDERDFLYGKAGADELHGDGGRDYLDGGRDDDDCFSGVTQVAC